MLLEIRVKGLIWYFKMGKLNWVWIAANTRLVAHMGWRFTWDLILIVDLFSLS